GRPATVDQARKAGSIVTHLTGLILNSLFRGRAAYRCLWKSRSSRGLAAGPAIVLFMTPLYSEGLDRYMQELLPARHPVFLEIEEQARQRRIPIVGPAVGTLLALLAESIGARRVFELGSAVGYSTAFFARAVGGDGRVFYTDGSSQNAEEARGYLVRLGLIDRVEVQTGEAVGLLEKSSGLFDVVFIDIDKEGYPAALEAAAPGVRAGGYLLADNVLWSGRVVDDSVRDAATEGIREFNRRLFSRTDFQAAIVPLRDGVAIARKRST